MADWPVNPIGNLFGESGSQFLEIWVDCGVDFTAGNTQQTVSDANIIFSIGIEYYDHTVISNVCHFTAELFKLDPTTGTEISVGYEFMYLPSDQKARNGHWWDTLSVAVTMTDPMENYRLHVHVDIPSGILTESEDSDIFLMAIQGVAAIGDFTLDFVPLTIVYCPPGQDMTNALTQSENFGTKFTIGNSSTFQSDTNVSLKLDFLGLIGEGIGFSNSQSVSNQSTSGIQVSHFRNTIVTADNQKAIGRAYWGPLNDIFVILVNPNFAVSRRADGSLFYCMQSIEQVLLIPARKLLRPDGDPIAREIPADVRQSLLELDPFITNLNLFFPDSGADLAQATDPFVDPSPNNRAELIGRWWLDGGTEVNYSVGESVELVISETNQVSYSSGVSVNASVGANYNGISAALGMGQSNKTTVGMQSSKENDAGYAKSAACFLIRNQNDRDLDGIELYFDKIFSTFMFRRLHRGEPKNMVAGTMLGTIYGASGLRMRAMNVTLVDELGKEHQTSTRSDGSYSFFNLVPGKYTLVAGDRRQSVTIAAEVTPMNPVRLDVKNARRPIDLEHSPVWEVMRALDLPSDSVRKIADGLRSGASLAKVGKTAGVDGATIKRWEQTVLIQTRLPSPKSPPKHRRIDESKSRGSKRTKRK